MHPQTLREYYDEHVIYNFYEFPRLPLDSNVGIGLFRLPPGELFQHLSCLDEVIVATDTQLQVRRDDMDFTINGGNIPADSHSLIWLSEAIEIENEDVKSDWLLPTVEEIVDDAQAIINTDIVADVQMVSSLDGSFNRQGNMLLAFYDKKASSAKAQVWRTESYGLYHSLHFVCNNVGEALYIRSLDLYLRPSGVHP